MMRCAELVLTSLLLHVAFLRAQSQGDSAATDELVSDLVGQSLFGNVKSEDLVNLLNAKAAFGSSADASLDESAIKVASVQKHLVVATSTSTPSPLLAASQNLKKLNVWATQKAMAAAANRAAAAQAVQRKKRLRALRAKVKAKPVLPPPQAQLGSPPVDIDEKEDISVTSDLGGIFAPVPLPNAAELVVKLAAPVDHPDLLATAPSPVHEIATQVVNFPQPVVNDSNTGMAILVPQPKPKLRKPLALPKASLGSSLGEVISDDNLTIADNSGLKLDLPVAPSPNAIAAAAQANKLFTEDLDSLADLDSLNTSSLMASSSNTSKPYDLGMKSQSIAHKVPVVAASIGPPLAAISSDNLGSLSMNRTVAQGAATRGIEPAESPDTQDSFLDEGLDESSKMSPAQSAQRSADRAKADASALHALDSEVQKGAAASAAEIDAAEAESEEGLSSIALPTVPLWAAQQG